MDNKQLTEQKLVVENLAWLDSVADGDIESAIEIAKSNTEVAGRWGAVWLAKRGFNDPLVAKCATAYQRFEKARLEHNKAHRLPPDAINSFLATDSGRRLYGECCRAEAERASNR